MLDTRIISDVFNAALKTGGAFAELFIEESARNAVSVVNGICEESAAGIDFGVGLRVFSGYNAVYGYTNDASADSLITLARQAAAAVTAKQGQTPAAGYGLTYETIHAVNNHAPKIIPDIKNKPETAAVLKQTDSAARRHSALITQTSASYADVVSNIRIINSEGLDVSDTRVRSRFRFTAVAGDGGEKQTATRSKGALMGYEFFTALDTDELVHDAVQTAVTMLSAKYAPGGRMPVVMCGGFGGVIFHEACGHSLEATAVAKGASVFCGKMGEQIANPVVTAIDDGTIPHSYGSINIDDEGSPARRTVLIENGVLKNYLVDRLNGLKINMPSTGSSRRESYRFAPTSRMTNTFIAPGTSSLDDMIRSADSGLFAKKMGGGSVNPATGEFNFAVSEGYLIKNGRITEPVRGATLIGKGADCLMNIDMIGSELSLEEGVCGSASGSVPVCVGQPPIRVQGLVVGGRG